MKKGLLSSVTIALATVLIAVYAHAEIDQRDFDGDGDIDGDDLSVFAEKFGSVAWYKDFDMDDHSDGITEYSMSRPTGYYLESELTAINGDCDDEDPTINPEAEETCDDGVDNDCDGEIDEDCIIVGACAAPITVEQLPAIFFGNTADAEELPNCDGVISQSHLFTFTAPVAGTYLFGIESNYDSKLSLFDASYCPNLGSESCLGHVGNTPGTSMRSLEISLGVGEQIFILIGGYFNYSTGNYTLLVLGSN